MTTMLHGALVDGQRSGPDASATVEARTGDGASRLDTALETALSRGARAFVAVAAARASS